MLETAPAVAPLPHEQKQVAHGRGHQPETAAAREPGRRNGSRLDSVDFLRGLVMVIMALDHVRFFLHRDVILGVDPLDLTKTNAALFFTRWITHFCAPVFVFLAGTGAYLSARRGKTKNELARFLLTRGLWLILLEFTLVKFGWTFSFDYHLTFAVVLWALGWAMVALAGLVYLPVWAAAAVGVAMIAGHNLLDGVQPESFGGFRWLWVVLHGTGPLQPTPGRSLVVTYPLVPWVGVMAAGYGFGALLSGERRARRRVLLRLGAGLTLAFILIRAANVYGDPQPWAPQKDLLLTALSFLNCEKYPPSLLFLLMTLGPSMFVLALFDGGPGALSRPFVVFGRVPLFYYLLHFPLIHLFAVALSYARYGQAPWLFTNPPWGPDLMRAFPSDYGYNLLVVYAVWVAAVAVLYPACKWFAGVKRRRRDAWLSYL
ncbi:MAG TPA: heparan-alpha-glucosaminide N-acetyltransferase domain-containing protein [Pyrinomonadaceae bacterium]|nr:heparan-alpha-glucosaminide N-acetyltransferase domain-containing protein [Pyrinomonadaceae bacterium]